MSNKRIFEYEVISNATDQAKTIARVWWTGVTTASDSPRILQTLKGISVMGKTFSDGVAFFNALPFHFRNGYLSLRRTK